jgi:hypothetical protein
MRLLPGQLAALTMSLLVGLFTASLSHAQTCGSDYTIKDKDTLADIAAAWGLGRSQSAELPKVFL